MTYKYTDPLGIADLARRKGLDLMDEGSSYPEGWMKNRDVDVVFRIERALERTNGNCPCVPHTEWDKNTMCPCLMFRSGEGCHCGLFVKENLDD